MTWLMRMMNEETDILSAQMAIGVTFKGITVVRGCSGEEWTSHERGYYSGMEVRGE